MIFLIHPILYILLNLTFRLQNIFYISNRVGEKLVCVECLKVIEMTNGTGRAEMQSCGMCDMPICSDQCQVTYDFSRDLKSIANTIEI